MTEISGNERYSVTSWKERTYIDGLLSHWHNSAVPYPPSTTGERVKARRRDLGISQSVLAERSGLSRDTIRRLESNENIGSAHLQRVAAALGMALVDLIGVAGRVAMPSDPPKMDRLQRIIDAYAGADEDDRQSLERQAAYVETSTALKREHLPSTAGGPRTGAPPDDPEKAATSGPKRSAKRKPKG